MIEGPHLLKRFTQEYCKAHPKGNPKITGTIKVIEHTKINNASLEMKLRMMLNVEAESSAHKRAVDPITVPSVENPHESVA